MANNRDSEAEHAIYLAAFAPAVFKVGITRLERLETRLREQGADRAAHVLTVPNGQIARERETAIEIDHDITKHVRVTTKIRGSGETIDESAWNELLAGFDVREELAFDYGLALDGRPVAETMLSGVVRGIKGRVLVLDHRNTTYAVDLRDLVGYELDEGRLTGSYRPASTGSPEAGPERFSRRASEPGRMADDEPEPTDEEATEESGDNEEQSFREQSDEEGEGDEQSREERMEEMMGDMMGGGGPGGGMGGGGGNPLAQMMGGGPGGSGEDAGNEELVREVRQLRDEVHDIRRTLERIADALED